MFEAAKKLLNDLLWELGLKDSVEEIQAIPAADGENLALICVIKKGNSGKLIATVFNEFDYFPKYVVIRERFADVYPDIDIKFLI